MTTIIVRGRTLHDIAPGVYTDGRGQFHVVTDEVLAAHGFADTPANREMCLAEVRAILAKQNPPVTLEELD